VSAPLVQPAYLNSLFNYTTALVCDLAAGDATVAKCLRRCSSPFRSLFGVPNNCVESGRFVCELAFIEEKMMKAITHAVSASLIVVFATICIASGFGSNRA
jgi:hypothetical protein